MKIDLFLYEGIVYEYQTDTADKIVKQFQKDL